MMAVGFEKGNTMSFKKAVESISDLSGGYCNGLKAMKVNSAKIIAADERMLSGSVDIDTCTKKIYPSDVPGTERNVYVSVG